MPRPKSADPKIIPVTVKMSHADLAVLDQERKGQTRSAYLRTLLMADRLRITPGDPVEVGILPEAGHPHPEPHPEPVDPPVPSPIAPPVPPPNPVETFTPPIPVDNPFTDSAPTCEHKWKTGNRYERCTRCGQSRRRATA